MHFRILRAAVMGFLPALLPLSACSLDAAMAQCAQCGQIRSIEARELRSDIRMPSLAPLARVGSAGGGTMVYDIRVRMDRGGSRDIVIASRAGLRVGDRVEIREGKLVPLMQLAGRS
jgi:hypothetical protein